MSEFWSGFLRTLAGGGVAVIVLAFLGRELLRQLLIKDLDMARAARDRELEAFKANLSHELEAYKGEIQRQTTEAGVQYEKVQDRLHEVVPETYAAFFGLFVVLRNRAYSVRQSGKTAQDAWGIAEGIFHRNVLYFSPESQRKSHAFLQAAAKSAHEWTRAVGSEPSEPARVELTQKLRQLFTEEVEPALNEVFNDFQRLLGVNAGTAAHPAAGAGA